MDRRTAGRSSLAVVERCMAAVERWPLVKVRLYLLLFEVTDVNIRV